MTALYSGRRDKKENTGMDGLYIIMEKTRKFRVDSIIRVTENVRTSFGKPICVDCTKSTFIKKI